MTRRDLTPGETASLAELAELVNAVARGIEATPYRLGQPAHDLAAGIALHVAAYLGRCTGDIPRLIRRLHAEPDRLRQERDTARLELHVLRSGLRAAGADPTQLQNLWAQISMRNRQWRTLRAQVAAALAVTATAEDDEALAQLDPEQYHHALGYAQALADVARAINTATAPTN